VFKHVRGNSGGFDYATFFGQIPEEDRESAVFTVGVVQFSYDFIIGF
jgi:hypothetical protein